MIEHVYRGPADHIEIKHIATGSTCPFCHSTTLKNCFCASCGTHIPSPLAERSPHSIRSRKQLRKPAYVPRIDGLQPDSTDPVDELAEYAALLQDIEVDCLEEDQADNLPTTDEIEELP